MAVLEKDLQRFGNGSWKDEDVRGVGRRRRVA
jgi:hypothetical protein